MYHYRESGLSNVYLYSGYREVQTPYGPSVVIQDVESLHFAIASTAVRERPHLTGPEVRFIRKYLEKTQAELASLLGVEEQSVRRWERLPRVPKPADRAVRLLFLNTIRDRGDTPAFEDLITNAEANDVAHAAVTLRYRPRARRDKWLPETTAA